MHAEGGDGPFRSWVGRVTWAVAGLVVASPMVAAWISWRGGWQPTGDQAVVSILSMATLSSHPPLVGMHSAATGTTGAIVSLYHPGPLQLWLLGPAFRAFAPSPIGGLIGSALLSSFCLAVVLVVAWRRGGTRWLAWAVLLTALFCSGARFLTLAQPLNLYLPEIALAAFLAAGWAVMSGDDWFWPVAVFAGSLTIQPELAYVFVAATSALAIVTVRAWYWMRARRDVGRRDTRRPRRITIVTVLVGIVCWAGPLWDQVRGSGNLWRLAHQGGELGTVMGPGWAFKRLIDVMAMPPDWIFPTFQFHWGPIDVGGSFLRPPLPVYEWLTAALFVAVYGWGLVHACRHRDRTRLTLGILAPAAFLGSFVSSMLMPASPYALHPGPWRASGLIAWLFAGVSAFDLLRRVSRPPFARWIRRVTTVAPAVSGATALVVLGTGLTLRSSLVDIGGTASYASVAVLSEAARPYCRSGQPVVVRSSDVFHYFETTGLAARIMLEGCPVRFVEFRDMFPSAAFNPTGREKVELLVSRAVPTPAGYRRIAVFDPAHPPARYRGYTTNRGIVQTDTRVELFARID